MRTAVQIIDASNEQKEHSISTIFTFSSDPKNPINSILNSHRLQFEQKEVQDLAIRKETQSTGVIIYV